MTGPEIQKPRPEEWVFDRRYLLLALVPVGVYALLYAVLVAARPDVVQFKTINPEVFATVAAGEAHYRYLWVSAFLLSCAASVTVAVGCAVSVWSDMPGRDRKFMLSLAAAVAAAFILVESQQDWFAQERWYVAMGSSNGTGLYEAIFGRLPSGDGGALLSLLDNGLDLIKACGAVALVLLTLALILTLVRRDGALPLERRAEQYAHALARQRSYLQQGATVYVFALIAMLSWMYWPLPFLADEATRDSYRQLLVGAAVLQGVGYSLAIAAIYLPPALLLRHQVARLAGEATDSASGFDDWLRDNGLDSQPLDQLRQFATLLMPALVSILPALNELWR